MLVLAVLAVAASAKADGKATAAASQRFEALKGLVGDWVKIGKDGAPTEEVVSSIRITAAGSAIEETLFPGTDHEMVTMYHLDGPDLVLTHYCVLGNQPRMRAEPGKDVNRIVFKFVGATNLKCKEDQHMHQATLAIDGKNHLKAEWVSCKEGTTCHRVTLDLARKQK
jgi:hypothetical protein